MNEGRAQGPNQGEHATNITLARRQNHSVQFTDFQKDMAGESERSQNIEEVTAEKRRKKKHQEPPHTL